MDEAKRRLAASRVDAMFDELATRVFSGRPGPSAESIPGIFHAASGERSPTTIRIIRPYLESLSHHLDAKRAQAHTEVIRALADSRPDAMELAANKIKADAERLLETEATVARNLGALQAAGRHAELLGVEDPVVVFLVHRVGACQECVRLHQTASGEPRAWLQSELGTGYHRRGEDNAKVGGLHPRCRCSLVYVPPGYGYRGGKLSFMSKDYSLLADQRKS